MKHTFHVEVARLVLVTPAGPRCFMPKVNRWRAEGLAFLLAGQVSLVGTVRRQQGEQSTHRQSGSREAGLTRSIAEHVGLIG